MDPSCFHQLWDFFELEDLANDLFGLANILNNILMGDGTKMSEVVEGGELVRIIHAKVHSGTHDFSRAKDLLRGHVYLGLLY